MPATSPQKAAPMPMMVMPEAAVTKVRMAGSRSSSLASALARAPSETGEQRQACDGLDQDRRRSADERSGHAGDQPQDKIGDAGGDRRRPATGRGRDAPRVRR